MKQSKTQNNFYKLELHQTNLIPQNQNHSTLTPKHIKFKYFDKNNQVQIKNQTNNPIMLSSLLNDLPVQKILTTSITHQPQPGHYYCKSTANNPLCTPSSLYKKKKIQLNDKPQRFIVKTYTSRTQKIESKNSFLVKSTDNKKKQPARLISIQSEPKANLLSEIMNTDYKQQPTLIETSAFQNEIPRISKIQKLKDPQEIDEFNLKLYGNAQIRGMLNFYKYPNLMIPKKQKFKQIRLSLIQYLRHIDKLKLTIQEILTHQVFPKKPFEHPLSKQFIQLCKHGCDNEIIQYLSSWKYLVYEYDHLLMTPLHWCALRGLESTAKILLKAGSDPDSQDIVGRTPLFLALLHNQNNIALFLILNKADPWNKINLNYLEAVQENPEGKTLLQQTRRTHILLRMTPPEQRQYIWQKEQLQMFEPHKKKQILQQQQS